MPRLVNILAHKALLLAFGEGLQQVLPRHVRSAAADTPAAAPTRTGGGCGFAMLLLAAGGASLAIWDGCAMSVINQMLLDLDRRRASGEERNRIPDHVRALPGEPHAARRRCRWSLPRRARSRRAGGRRLVVVAGRARRG